MAKLLAAAALALCGTAAAGAAEDCAATAVAADGSTSPRACAEVDPHDTFRGKPTKGTPGGSAGAGGGAQGPAVHPNFEHMKGSRWLWNNWREVEFTADGYFVAPAENCDNPGNAACTWSATEDHIIVNFGNAGTHTLNVDGTSMSGSRDSDGDAVQGVRV
eukprot:CAMPEP_0182920654 /NCGR_PEP_ID=MMETSP0105_2-20130417/3628_1 /TAXON_ID=81532 ORGANISM="Acanthoeca-like sp., Strain 10tr" /NCGR_SAMPLE_ID=MMETSP0105_2 /ASSEMBLY_ACC=CAM_ASM_000205 /LENGTH=160 /DNA_ID=CAMNT_0025058089 /DNA_START=221 /DNA_END=703 /DNA_ORIENTATION=-